ncbi:MAG: hypothetical protein KC731_42630 [Myxococcales bacterium]|nr:hypothetical protein [Myxococcales bacterium]
MDDGSQEVIKNPAEALLIRQKGKVVAKMAAIAALVATVLFVFLPPPP